MKSLGEVLQLSTSFLQERQIPKARRLAEELIAGALKMKRIDLYMQFDQPVEERELASLRDWLKRCAKGEPVEYIVGEIDFYGCNLQIDSRVLIPRPETEILVDLIVKQKPTGICWDLCTGSGCIGLGLKKAVPELKVVLSDLSEGALAVAEANAKRNGLDVELRKGDLLEPFQGQKADLIVANPPYITSKEYLDLSPSVRDFEPALALVGGERGTELYERLSVDLPDKLNPGGRVYFEIGTGQGEVLKKIFAGGPWVRSEVEKDWAGHDRFFFLEKQ